MELILKEKKKKLNKGSATNHTKGDILFYCLLLLLPLVQLGIFYFGVNFQSILLSFEKYDAVNGTFSFDSTFDNFHRLFGGGSYDEGLISTNWFWIMIRNSFVVYLFTSLAGTVLAVFFSYYIYKKRTASNFFKIMLFLPSILPGILLVIIYRMFIGEGIPTFLESIFNIKDVANIWGNPSDERFLVITLFTVWVSFGSQVLVYTGAMDRIPYDIIEAGQLDGASSMREFISLIVPEILPTVSTFLIGGLAGIFTAQNNLFAFTSGTADATEQTIGYYLYMLVYSGDKTGYAFASFMGLFFTLIILPIIVLVRKLVNKVSN